MRRICAGLLVTLSVLSLFVVAAGPASAATGNVSVFSTEATPLDVFEDPSGCNKLPAAAHVLLNQTDGPIQIYADPICLTPSLTVEAGYGTHVPALTGSFSA